MPPTYNIQKVLFTVVEDPPQNLIFIALSAETSLVVFKLFDSGLIIPN